MNYGPEWSDVFALIGQTGFWLAVVVCMPLVARIL